MVTGFISNKFTMTTALLEFPAVGTVSIKIELYLLKDAFHLNMALYFIIYSAMTRGGNFSAVQMFQVLFTKKTKNKIKLNYTFGNILSRMH